jgi:hypothetical protein
MKIWESLLRGIGGVTLAFCVSGFYYWGLAALRVFRHPFTSPEAPFFRAAFWTMSCIDAILLAAIAFASFQLVRLRPKAAIIYACSVLASVAYAFLPGSLWLIPNGIGRSIAAASGVGSMGTAPLMMFPIPFAYPLISVVLVSVGRWKIKSANADLASIQHVKTAP